MALIAPHGGTLVNRITPAPAAAGLRTVTLSPREAFDLEMIAIGAFSPLTGFMGQADFTRVCKEMRLASGTVWPIPVVLSPADEVTAKVNVGQKIALLDPKGRPLGTMTVTEKYAHDKALEIPNVYRTEDEAHPGVKIVKGQGNFCNLAGADRASSRPTHEPEFSRVSPAASARPAKPFAAKGWSTVAAFQTRNPIHRSHEYLTKCRARDDRWSMLIHPLVGETKSPMISPPRPAWIATRTLVDNYTTTPSGRCSA